MKFFNTTITTRALMESGSCVASGMLSEGEQVKRFEDELKYMGYKNPVTVNSGTSALHLALLIAGVKEGDEVILPAQTFVATGLAILYCKAKPVFADIDLDGNIDIDNALGKVTDKTKALICVAWGGNPCNLIRLQQECESLGIVLIQDNAQAFGATYQGQLLCNYGDFSCYSFQAIKHLSTGDGGMITCPDGKDKIAKRLRWFGIDRETDVPDETGERHYNLQEVGYKYHMNDYSASLGLGNLYGIKERLTRVRWIASYYRDNIHSLFGRDAGCSYWLYDELVDRRDDFIRMMKSKGIPVSVVHVGIDRNDIFGGLQDLPIQRYWDKNHICLPIHSNLSDDDVQKVVDAFNGGW